MTARDELFESMTPTDRRPAPGEADAVNALLDEYRDDVRAEVRRELLGDDLNPSALVEDAESYKILRSAIEATMADPDRWDGDEAEVAILARYVEWLAAGQPEDEPDFFQVGHTYRINDGIDRADFLGWIFRVEHITQNDGKRTAFGYLTNRHPEAAWNPHFEGEESWAQGWDDIAEDGGR